MNICYVNHFNIFDVKKFGFYMLKILLKVLKTLIYKAFQTIQVKSENRQM